MLDALWQDVRHSARSLLKTAGFTLTAVVTLALGIGATTAVLRIVDGVLLRPLVYQEPDRLYVVHEVIPAIAATRPLVPVNFAHFQEWRSRTESFDEMGLISLRPYTLTGTGEPTRLDGARVSPRFFDTLGVNPALGRFFSDGEDVEGRDRVVVLGHEVWASRFAADPGVVGRSISLNGEPHTVVGVLPVSFGLPRLGLLYAMDADLARPLIWKPFAPTPNERSSMGAFNHMAVVRLKRGVSATQALDELNTVQADVARRAPERTELRAALVPMADQVTSRSRGSLQLVLAAVTLVFFVACVNITNLLLVRNGRRQREFAIRQAAGARSRQLVQQVLIESLVVATMAGILSLAIDVTLVHVLRELAPVDLPRLEEIAIDARSLLGSFATTLLTGLFVGLLPARQALRPLATDLLRSSSATVGGGSGARRLRSLLVGLEVAASVVCLVAGALFVTSFGKLMAVDRGFDTGRVLTMELVLPVARYPTPVEGVRFAQAVVDRARAIPGVVAAGMTDRLPLTQPSNSAVMVEGANLPRQQRPLATIRSDGGDYLRAMGVRMLSGTALAARDASTRVAVVSAQAAAQLWPAQDPLGKRFRVGPDDSPFFTVVGVAADVRSLGLGVNPPLTIYVPPSENFYNVVSLAVRIDAATPSAARALRVIVSAQDAELAVPQVRTMDDMVSASVAPRRFQTTLVAALAVAGLLLVCLGIYGVVSHAVAQQAAELGIRMALGAGAGRILRLVLGQGIVPVGAGLVAGLALAIATGRWLQTLLFEVSPTDVGSLAAAAGLLLSVALLGMLIPAWRAARLDPMTAVRVE